MTAFNTDTTLHHHADSTTAQHRSPWRAWSFHLAEMMIAMFAGMAVLGFAVESVLTLLGASLSDAPAAVMASVMAFNMTAPMAWWMRYRGHSARHNIEMSASMIVPTALVIVLHWLGAVTADSVLLIQHVVVIPAMVGVMLARFEHYAHSFPAPATCPTTPIPTASPGCSRSSAKPLMAPGSPPTTGSRCSPASLSPCAPPSPSRDSWPIALRHAARGDRAPSRASFAGVSAIATNPGDRCAAAGNRTTAAGSPSSRGHDEVPL